MKNIKIVHHVMDQKIDNKLYPGDALVVSLPALTAVFKCIDCDWRLTTISANGIMSHCVVVGTDGRIDSKDADRIDFWFGPQYKNLLVDVYERFEKFLSTWRIFHPIRTKYVGFNRNQKERLLSSLTIRGGGRT